MSLEVITPSVAYESAFLAMLGDFERSDPSNAEFYLLAKADFPAYVQSLLDEELGLNLRDGWVPCTHRWLVSADHEVCAVARLRHSIATPFLSLNGGHIGYDVAPSHRGKGYGHAALRAALAEAQRLQLARVLMFTGDANTRSRAVIERQGGILESTAYSEFWNEQLCKYWVTVPPQG